MLEAHSNGHEIAYHGYSQVSNTREQFLHGLDVFAEMFGHPPKTFFKHGGHLGLHKESMCKKEDLAYLGCQPGPYYVADIVEERFNCVWEFHRLFDMETGKPDSKIRSDRDILYPRAKNFGFWRHRLGHLTWPDVDFPDKLAKSSGVFMGYSHFGYDGWPREAALEHWMGDDLDRAIDTLTKLIETYDVWTPTVDEFCSKTVLKYNLKTVCQNV